MAGTNSENDYEIPSNGYQNPSFLTDVSHLEARNPYINLQKLSNEAKVNRLDRWLNTKVRIRRKIALHIECFLRTCDRYDFRGYEEFL